jgi:hypothetical protein
MADRGACISRRAPKTESFFDSRKSPKHSGFAFADLFAVIEYVGGRNRLTSSAIFDREK